jgi:hypothetical protein
MMVRVPRTLVATSPASFDATLQSDAGELRDELCLPAEDVTGRDADVAAVQTELDARDEILDIGLAQVGVRTRRARLSTVEAQVDAGDQRAELHPERPRIRLQNLLSV